jgi:hypothetical protein
LSSRWLFLRTAGSDDESSGPDEYDFNDGFLVEDDSEDDALGIHDDGRDSDDSDDADYNGGKAAKAKPAHSHDVHHDHGEVSATFVDDEMAWEVAKDDKEAAREAREWLAAEGGASKKRPRKKIVDLENYDDDEEDADYDMKPPLAKRGSGLKAAGSDEDGKQVQFERWKAYIKAHPANKKKN